MNRFTLDTVIEDEGGNLSIGQRSLVSLTRALVKDAKVIILDEATDMTKDRLRTIIAYDRICVLDAGEVAEFDTPVQLYHIPNGIFRGMCGRSSITLEDLQLPAKIMANDEA
ncbi:hypothetical protein FPV67DRAFT_1769257 [Lyophyllum atratum]|nr:hypothetical protein FPV67DRAFT_1769257 [Lyophyllum atratum]